MAQNDNAFLIINGGNFFTAPHTGGEPVEMPTDLDAVASPWEEVGHTSLEDIFSVTSEGGEATPVGSLQNRNLRNIYSARTETFNITLQQWDTPALKLYYGANAGTDAEGNLEVPERPVPTIASFLAVFQDGDKRFAFYAPKAEILRSEDIAISDTESGASLPLGIKPVLHGTNKFPYKITPLGVTP